MLSQVVNTFKGAVGKMKYRYTEIENMGCNCTKKEFKLKVNNEERIFQDWMNAYL